ncbi:MAG: CAP domain-containing protein [Pseudomonadota bacterium]
MKRLFILCLGVLTCSSAAFACNIASDQARLQIVDYVRDGRVCLETPPEGFRFDEVVERAFMTKMNEERKRKGLHALKLRTDLRPAARFQSLDMGVNEFFEHESPDGRRAAARIAAFDRTLLAQSTGENIAVFGPAKCYDQNDNEVSCFNLPGFRLPSASDIVEDLHQKLMESEGHRANILSEDFTRAAVGVARTDSGFYVTQLFANPVGTLPTPLPALYEVDTRLDVMPDLTGWTVGNYTLIDSDGTRIDLKSDRLRGLAPGDMTLIVTGERTSEEERGARTYIRTEWLNLNGPSFTLSAAKGS